ncbi:EPIDERMAL PATTERNING FACTOR-like protein 9 isoform X1 [Quercus lobata]|nr:EPIDERMAL PATTERNING FACTOR-like protein 9 isoform X1 [Quercus lobata]
MANIKLSNLLLLLITLIMAAYVIQGSTNQQELPHPLSASHSSQPQRELHLQGGSERVMMKNSRRLMIGSTAPTCTYNECRGCKYRCRAEQVPVEGNDPVNSAYHYKCVCHRCEGVSRVTKVRGLQVGTWNGPESWTLASKGSHALTYLASFVMICTNWHKLNYIRQTTHNN